ncbi:hypothetical protein HRbin01_00537 [archaeon HR01]|nr:hypothetical protein HRbin01_00537 [archaeon HR01]
MERKALIVLVAAVVAAVAAGSILLLGGPALEVHDVSVRAGTGSLAVFLTIHNHGLLGDCLVNVKVLHPEGLRAELHRTVMDAGGVMRMERVDKICVGGLGEVKLAGLEEGGLHIMVVGGDEDVHEVMLELVFESGRTITVKSGVGGDHSH